MSTSNDVDELGNLRPTADELVTELTMSSSFSMNLIVEGTDDFKFFTSTLNGHEKVNIICSWGSENVCEIIYQVNQIKNCPNLKPTLGIIDRDYRIPLNTLPNQQNLLHTDLRDLECMMINSRAWEAVLRELTSKVKLEKCGGLNGIFSIIISTAETIGKARFYSQYKNIKTSFKKLEIDTIICKKTLAIDNKKLIQHLNSKQIDPKNHLPSNLDKEVAKLINTIKCNQNKKYFHTPLLICRGHDIMEIIGISLRSLLANLSAKESTRESIEQSFRLSYSAYFKNSQLAKSIDSWLSTNSLQNTISIN